MPSFKNTFYPEIGTIGYSNTVYRDMTCDVSLSVGDMVYPSDTIEDKALECVNNSELTPAIGIVILKETTTACTVMLIGKYSSSIAGLVGNKKVFLGTDGKPTTTLPSVGYIQNIGYCEVNGKFFCTTSNKATSRVKRNPFT